MHLPFKLFRIIIRSRFIFTILTPPITIVVALHSFNFKKIIIVLFQLNKTHKPALHINKAWLNNLKNVRKWKKLQFRHTDSRSNLNYKARIWTNFWTNRFWRKKFNRISSSCGNIKVRAGLGAIFITVETDGYVCIINQPCDCIQLFWAQNRCLVGLKQNTMIVRQRTILQNEPHIQQVRNFGFIVQICLL